ncbi:putative Protein MON2-like protein [Hypsibius exemplaris]|uniref:Mon2 C-terminal domain-containing protein n=1 Tax=Hypsibius exemplaris TaxID=2072580 RepID=A0A1W0X730_HYPEX|nr:putative Protein MON2-like protein [Hypsibius exemplaris]
MLFLFTFFLWQRIVLHNQADPLDGLRHIIPTHNIPLQAAHAAIHQPLKLRQVDAHQTAWRVAVESILKTVRITLPHVNVQSAPVFYNVWIHLASAVDDVLYGDDGQIVEWGTDDVDFEVMNFFRSEILPHVALIPIDDLKFTLNVFHKGSLHRHVMEPSHVLPTGSEKVATLCFEALLDFHLYHAHKIPEADDINLPAILLRCEKILSGLTAESDTNAVSRGKNSLRCIKSVLHSIKQTSVTNVDRQVWHDVIMLYPKLVGLVPVHLNVPLRAEFRNLLAAALLQYSELIQPPFKL